jgi:hypothetical protein
MEGPRPAGAWQFCGRVPGLIGFCWPCRLVLASLRRGRFGVRRLDLRLPHKMHAAYSLRGLLEHECIDHVMEACISSP